MAATVAATSAPVRFYVAGKYADMERINALVRRLELSQSASLTCSHNWAKRAIERHTVDASYHLNIFDAQRSMQVDAIYDIGGVRTADIVLVLMDDANYKFSGTWTEVGAALGLDKPVIIINPGGDVAPVAQNVFYWFPTVQHAVSIDDGVTLLYKWAAATEAAAAVVASASAASLP